jgi:ZIP family zinc transporter
MSQIFKLLIFSGISGFAVVLGGFLGTKKIPDKVMAFILTFGSGVLLSVVSFTLMHEAYRKSGPVYTSIAFIMGGIVFFFAERLLNQTFTEGMGLLLGTALDDLPEALSMGIGFASDSGGLGMVLGLSVFLHNIPEGISSTNDLITTGKIKPSKAFLMAAVISFLDPVAALTGYYLLHDMSDVLMGVVLAFSGGSILFMTGTDMIPKAHSLGTKSENFGLLFGFLVAFLISRIMS